MSFRSRGTSRALPPFMKKFLLGLIAVAAVLLPLSQNAQAHWGYYHHYYGGYHHGYWGHRYFLLVWRVLAPRLLVRWSGHGCCRPVLMPEERHGCRIPEVPHREAALVGSTA
jgi:hypothetical protein